MTQFSFTSDMISTLQTALTNLNSNLGMAGAGAQAYEDVLSDISQIESIPVELGTSIDVLVPADLVDNAVWDYFNGAVQINEDVGAQGQFVNLYTNDQASIRMPKVSLDPSFSNWSNQIAASSLLRSCGLNNKVLAE